MGRRFATDDRVTAHLRDHRERGRHDAVEPVGSTGAGYAEAPGRAYSEPGSGVGRPGVGRFVVGDVVGPT